jgi:hypothetical protein
MTHAIPDVTPDTVRMFFHDLCTTAGFWIIVADYRPDIFGNIQVVASNDRYSVDYRRDRGDESVFVAIAGKEYLVDDVRELLDVHTSGPSDLQSDLAFLLGKANEIDRFFSAESVDSSIEALEKMRVRRLHRMFPGSVAEA